MLRRGLYLEYLTLGWNVVGAIVIIVAAVKARSVALAGFGLDSLIEIFASVVVVWELTGAGHGRERTALRLIGTAFFALALYILLQAGYTLATRAHPATSPGASPGWRSPSWSCCCSRGARMSPASGSTTRCCAPRGA